MGDPEHDDDLAGDDVEDGQLPAGESKAWPPAALETKTARA